MLSQLKVHRRHFLVGAGSLGATALMGTPGGLAQEASTLPPYVSWKDAGDLIAHSELTLETERGAIGTGVVTPSNVLFVRNNLAPPDETVLADRDAWEVSIGGVNNPRGITVGELKTLGLDTVATVLQCSGNGRGFYDHQASGSPWLTGAAGCVIWSGVSVKTVSEALGGVVSGARYITSTGGETLPEGVDPLSVVVKRSVPLEAMDDAILAWEMNGEPIPLAHGGPLRVIVPGYYGVNNVKYVRELAFTADESDAAIQVSGYRVRPVGVSGAPDQPSMWEMKVKSWVTHPLADSSSGLVQIYGVAFGGPNEVEKVEVTIDGGSTWQEARLIGPNLGRFGWRVFVLPVELGAGTYVIASRATDSAGRVQEEITEPNHRGYDYSGWSRLAVEVTVAA